MANKIKWEEPPADKRGRFNTEYDQIAETLKSRPEEWALVAKKVDRSFAEGLKRRGVKVRQIRAGRKYPDGRFDIYALWPEPEQDAA